jgi:hypothetical protein
MFRHIVLVRWKPDVEEEAKTSVQLAISALAAQVPEIVALQMGLDVGRGPNNYDLAVVIDFQDRSGFGRYLASDAHHAYVSGPGKAAVGSLASLQHEW